MKSVRVITFALVASLAFTLAACGGGGGGGSSPVLPPGQGGGGGTNPTPHGSSSPGASPSASPIGSAPPGTHPSASPSALPSGHPTATPIPVTPTPLPTPTIAPTYYPADPASKLRSTYGRIGLAQIFDYFPNDGTSMSASQIAADASRYDMVWASFDPAPWRGGNPQALVSRYYITEEDNEPISGHNLQWWQQNHPDWILYACDSSGNPTTDIAYSPGDGFPDVPLDMHNPAVVQYQIQSLISYATANGYNAIALDNVDFTDIMQGGNPELGQTVKPGEYGCGIENQDGTFTKIYQSTTDPTWTSDILNWVENARAAANSAGLALIVNHPIGATGNANEATLIRNIDVMLDESGYSDYGNYAPFASTYTYAEWVESQGVGFTVIDRWTNNNQTAPTSDQLEYSIATYLMANEGNEDLYVSANNSAGTGYGAEQYHQEYATPIGQPCAAMYGGSSYDPSNPAIYYRRFAGGMAIVNASASTPEQAKLPTDHTYTDLEGRTVTNPLTVNADDAYVLTTTNGCS